MDQGEHCGVGHTNTAAASGSGKGSEVRASRGPAHPRPSCSPEPPTPPDPELPRPLVCAFPSLYLFLEGPLGLPLCCSQDTPPRGGLGVLWRHPDRWDRAGGPSQAFAPQLGFTSDGGDAPRRGPVVGTLSDRKSVV